MILHFHSTFPFLQFWTNRTCFAKQAASVARPKAAWSVTARGCGAIFHPIGVQAIADDYHVRLFFVWKWRMWRKRDEQTWQKLNNNGTFNFSFGGVVWKKLNYNMDQHNSEPVASTSPPKRKTFGTSQTRIWKWYPSPESGLGIWQAWKLCATSCTSYGTALPFFLSRLLPSQLGLKYREYLCRLFIEISLTYYAEFL